MQTLIVLLIVSFSLFNLSCGDQGRKGQVKKATVKGPTPIQIKVGETPPIPSPEELKRREEAVEKTHLPGPELPKGEEGEKRGKKEKSGEEEDKEDKKVIIIFVFIVNETGKDILLKAIVDGEELFAQEVGAEVKTKKYPREAPPLQYKYPSKELKVEIRRSARSIKLQEIYSKRKEKEVEYDITNFIRKVGGFRINVRQDGISFVQDYIPIR